MCHVQYIWPQNCNPSWTPSGVEVVEREVAGGGFGVRHDRQRGAGVHDHPEGASPADAGQQRVQAVHGSLGDTASSVHVLCFAVAQDK